MEERLLPKKIRKPWNNFLKAVNCIEQYDLEGLKIVIFKNPDIVKKHNRLYRGFTLLHYGIYYSIYYEKYDIISYLLDECEIDIDAKTHDDRTALSIAAGFCDLTLVKLLLEHDTDVNIKIRYLNMNIIFSPISSFNDEQDICKCLKYLIDYGAEINSTVSIFNQTPLILSIEHGLYHVMRFLVNNGANPDHSVTGGVSPLVEISIMYYDDVKFLLDHGARVDIPCVLNDKKNIYTPLHLNVEFGGELDKTKLLLDYGADPLFKDSKGKSPLDYAIEQNDKETVELLKKYIKDKE